MPVVPAPWLHGGRVVARVAVDGGIVLVGRLPSRSTDRRQTPPTSSAISVRAATARRCRGLVGGCAVGPPAVAAHDLHRPAARLALRAAAARDVLGGGVAATHRQSPAAFWVAAGDVHVSLAARRGRHGGCAPAGAAGAASAAAQARSPHQWPLQPRGQLLARASSRGDGATGRAGPSELLERSVGRRGHLLRHDGCVAQGGAVGHEGGAALRGHRTP